MFGRIRYTTAPNAALAYVLTPAFTVLFLALVMKQRPGWKRVVGIAVAFVFAAIVLPDRGAGASVFNNLQPIFTTILAFLIFGTQPTMFFCHWWHHRAYRSNNYTASSRRAACCVVVSSAIRE
ncbi:MAG: EamA family transporter [Ignavibacteria bacterium]|nr:EamA family transporter [Ignavibacteria bacterium]